MATTLPLTPGFGLSNGESFTADDFRWAGMSAFDLLAGSAGNLSRGGIQPAGQCDATGSTAGRFQGLKLTPQGSPAMSLNVSAGRIAIPANSSGAAPIGAALLTDGVLDGFGAAHATVARTDLIIAEAQITGSDTSLCQLRILPGTNGSTARTALPTTPGVTHAVSIGTVTIQSLATRPSSNIQASDISWVQSDTWTKDTADAWYLAAPGGRIIAPVGILSASSTRRNAWAALHPDGTPWVELVAKVEGYIRAGQMIPTTPRILHDFYDATNVDAAALQPDLATHPSLTLIGGDRLIRVDASCTMSTATAAGVAGARAYVNAFAASGSYLQQSVAGPNGDNLMTASRSWTFVQPAGTIGANTWKMQGLRDGGSVTVRFTQRKLQILDLGPA